MRFLWKRTAAIPWLLGPHPLLTTKPACHRSHSFVGQPLSLHILSYAQRDTDPGFICDSLFRLWNQQKRTLNRGKSKASRMWSADTTATSDRHPTMQMPTWENLATAQRIPGHRTEWRFIWKETLFRKPWLVLMQNPAYLESHNIFYSFVAAERGTCHSISPNTYTHHISLVPMFIW